ncbi:hypothetical protein AY601_5059 [Pedobacter cryoconitis]|uniref:Uncharacterized protein n=1 Tax=Pedobacter cryoconitis TaxID=188932 RepID=A0A127VKR7_9SPHI|nr:hypothetical protein [Pedobacter cryoconitis]AMQ01872.1 hypothetical protein AY601_5059 [Pedobacter cryoconitis]
MDQTPINAAAIDSEDQSVLNQFFSETNDKGYFTKAEFMEYTNRLSCSERESLKRVFELTSKSYKLTHLSSYSSDADSIECGRIKCKFKLPNAKVKIHLLYHHDMYHFLLCYQENIHQGWWPLEDLISILTFDAS